MKRDISKLGPTKLRWAIAIEAGVSFPTVHRYLEGKRILASNRTMIEQVLREHDMEDLIPIEGTEP